MSTPSQIAASMASVIGENDEESTVTRWLDTGFAPLNDASSATWGNGFPVGRIIEIAGPPSSGKTAIATRAMAAAQRQGGIAGFMDHERSFSTKLAPKLGLDITPGPFIFKKPKTFEESVGIFGLACEHIRGNKLIKPEAPICWVFDSLAAMVPHSALYDSKTGARRDPKDRNMNDNTALARATSAHFPALAMQAEEYNVCMIFLNQLRNKIGVAFGDPRKTTGGDSPGFYFSQRLWLSAAQIGATAAEKKAGKDVVGMTVTGKMIKNKVSRPFKTASWKFMFEEDGTGRFDVEASLIEFLSSLNLLETDGKYIVWKGKKLYKKALAEAVRAAGPDGLAELEALLPKEYEPEVVAEVSSDELIQ